MSRLLDVFDLRQPLLRSLADGLPAFGSCAGMIMLATDILDPASAQRPRGAGHRCSGQRLRPAERIVRGRPYGRRRSRPGGAGSVHPRPWVERVGDQVQVLARVGDHPVAVRQGAVLATSFHPEITGDLRLHQRFLTLVTTRIAAVGHR